MKTRDRLAAELRKIAQKASPANAQKYETFAARAATGEFDDYATPTDPEHINPLGPAFTSVTFNEGASTAVTRTAADRPHLELHQHLNAIHAPGEGLDWHSNNNWEKDEVGEPVRHF